MAFRYLWNIKWLILMHCVIHKVKLISPRKPYIRYCIEFIASVGTTTLEHPWMFNLAELHVQFISGSYCWNTFWAEYIDCWELLITIHMAHTWSSSQRQQCLLIHRVVDYCFVSRFYLTLLLVFLQALLLFPRC